MTGAWQVEFSRNCVRIAELLRTASRDLQQANDAAQRRIITIEADMLRAIIADAVDNVRRVVIEENYPHGPGYEEISCVGGDYVPAEEVDRLVGKIMAEVCAARHGKATNDEGM